MIPYGRQQIDNDDIKSVIEVLHSDWLTTGPQVDIFEKALSEFTGAKYAVAVNSGTAALHAAMYCAGIQNSDEVIVPAMTFVATANAVVFQGGTPIFADVYSDTLLINPELIESKITPKTKAIVAVDYAGQPSDYKALKNITDKHNLILISDACHSIGAEYHGIKVGNLADLTVFSFHPVKHITTGEGGAVLTNNIEFARKIRKFRNHGISTDHRERMEQNSWFYTMDDLGYNYRITDFQCALGTSQLKKLPAWIDKRIYIAEQYNKAFKDNKALNGYKAFKDNKAFRSSDFFQIIEPLKLNPKVKHAYHLYVVKINSDKIGITKADLKINSDKIGITRADLFSEMRNQGIGVNVHYIPVHLHPFYQKKFNCKKGDCPEAEKAYEQILSLPIFPAMTDKDIDTVINTLINSLFEICSSNKKNKNENRAL